VQRQGEIELGQYADVPADGPTYGQTGRNHQDAGGRRHHGMRVLSPEPEPAPRVHESHIVRRNQRVVGGPPLVVPAGGSDAVQVADGLGIPHGLSGGFDPEVRAPDRGGLGSARR